MSKKQFICKQCEKEFEAYTSLARKRPKYCSQGCFRIDSKKIKSICPICDQGFLSYKRSSGELPKYCSRKCYRADQGLKVKSTCFYCNKDFETHKRSSGKLPKYCSLKCRVADKKIYNTCKNCGRKYQYYVGKNSRYFCSQNCSEQYGYYRRRRSIDWTKEAVDMLKVKYPQCSRQQIEGLFPEKSWTSICTKAYYLHLFLGKKDLQYSQNLALDIIDQILGEKAVRNKRYKWMRSPKGWPLEIDGHYSEHNLAVEYQGQQHFTNNFLGHDDFKYQQICDTIKREAIQKHNIHFLEIKYNEPLTEEHLRERVEDLLCQPS
jgi:ribosomal protein L24E